MTKRVRPADLIYDVDQRPPLGELVVLGLQHIAAASVYLLLPLVIAQAAGVSDSVLESAISLSMVAMAVGVLLQAWQWKGLGSGLLVPSVPTSIYLSPSMQAVQLGGMPLVYGMTLVAGLFEAALSRFLNRLRPYFPPEVAGVAVVIVGLELGTLGFRKIMNLEAASFASGGVGYATAIGFGTFALSFLLSIYGKGWVRLFSSLIGIVAGYGTAVLMGLMSEKSASRLKDAALFDLPSFSHLSFSFDPALAIPFALAGLSAMLKTVAAVTTAQKVNDSAWTRADMKQIQGGVAADGLTTATAGLLGSSGQNSATSNIGVSAATGATSRWIALPIAGWLLILACSPKFAAVFVAMPDVVVGGSFLFVSCFVLVNGLQIIASRMLDTRRTAVVGLSIILAESRFIFPDFFKALPESVQPFVGSSLALGITAAFLLNLVFRIGIRQREGLAYRPGVDTSETLHEFLERCGQRWGARGMIVERATQATVELVEAVQPMHKGAEPILVKIAFDEYSLNIDVSYAGPPLSLKAQPPTPEEMLENPDLALSLGGMFVARLADRAEAVGTRESSMVKLHFEH